VYSPETQSRIAILRQKATEGTITLDEMREAVVLLRAGRMGAAISSEQARKTRAKKEVRTADQMLGELGI
jgi:hypothetical protein